MNKYWINVRVNGTHCKDSKLPVIAHCFLLTSEPKLWIPWIISTPDAVLSQINTLKNRPEYKLENPFCTPLFEGRLHRSYDKLRKLLRNPWWQILFHKAFKWLENRWHQVFIGIFKYGESKPRMRTKSNTKMILDVEVRLKSALKMQINTARYLTLSGLTYISGFTTTILSLFRTAIEVRIIVMVTASLHSLCT